MSKEDNLLNEQELISACIQNNPRAQKIHFEPACIATRNRRQTVLF